MGPAGGANVRLRQVQEQHARQALSDYRIVAPISGVVLARNINPGEIAAYIAPRVDTTLPLSDDRRSLFVVADDSAMEFLANVDQRHIPHVQPGQRATLKVDAYPGDEFSGKVVRVNPLVTPSPLSRGADNRTEDHGRPEGRRPGLPDRAPARAGTFKVWIRVPNPERRLVAGLTGVATIHVQEQTATARENAR
jgi:hypothetical protein